MSTINGSIEMAVKYTVQAVEWIYSLVHNSKGSTVPFQFDLSFAVGEPEMREQIAVDHDDDDDDDEDDIEMEEQEYVDYVGNIEMKLTSNKLKYSKAEIDFKYGRGRLSRVFEKLYGQYLKENNMESPKDNVLHLRYKRLISMVDLRQHAHGQNIDLPDTIFMYEPPRDCRDIPQDAVPEWYFASSRMCLLPALHDEHDRYGMEKRHPDKYQGIGAAFELNSSMMTMSFHVKDQDVVKLYLYHNAQCIRFMPEDIKIILPLLFNMDYGDNARWISEMNEVNGYIDRMRRCLKDVEFEAFQQSYM